MFYFKDNTNTLVRIYMHYTYIIYYIDSVYTYVVFVQIDKYIYMGVCTCSDTHRCTLGHLYDDCWILMLSWIRAGWVQLLPLLQACSSYPLGPEPPTVNILAFSIACKNARHFNKYLLNEWVNGWLDNKRLIKENCIL